MGDYYKIKKILLILIIVLTIIRIFKTSNVFASEAVEVTPTWNDGSYTYQADNNILTLQQNQINIQNAFIQSFYRFLGTSYENNAKTTLEKIHAGMSSTAPGQLYGSGVYTRFFWFGRVLSSVNGSQEYNFFFQVVQATSINHNNIVYQDVQLNDGYKLISQPFYKIQRDDGEYLRYFNAVNGTFLHVNTGEALVPVAELGVYSSQWTELFKDYGLIDTAEYNDILASIEQTNEENYTANLYTKQAVQNTYSYLTNDNIEEITSLGISQPQVTEQVDLTDVLDSLEALLTNETYTTKFFTITLPNGRGSTFALSPELLENNLNRVGGQNIVSIIHAVWYIGLYGWYIFSLLGIYGKLLTGDLFHLVKGCSPITNLVKMSVGTISGGKF